MIIIKTKTIFILKQSILATIMISSILSCKENSNRSKREVVIEEPIKNDNSSVKSDPVIFKKSLLLHNIGFNISTTGEGSIQQLTIQPSGLEINNRKITVEVVGNVTDAEIADLNSDRFPELLIYTTSAGSGSYGDVIGYSVNNGKSISPIYFPSVAENKKINKGYMGHDEFAIAKNLLVQRFKVYNNEDVNSNPTGNIREIYYKLKNGEATKEFVVENVIDYPVK